MSTTPEAPTPSEGGCYIMDKNGVLKRDSREPQTKEWDPTIPAEPLPTEPEAAPAEKVPAK